jgi:hypothetical protein
MMETERVSETLVFNSELTRLITREDFIAFVRRESFKSYMVYIDKSVSIIFLKMLHKRYNYYNKELLI